MKIIYLSFVAAPFTPNAFGQCPPNLSDRTVEAELVPLDVDSVTQSVKINQGSAVIGYQTMYDCDTNPTENGKSGSIVVRKLSQRNGFNFKDEGPDFPAFMALNLMNTGGESAARFFASKNGNGAVSIGSGEGNCDWDPYVAPNKPSLFVCKGASGGGIFNTNGSKNKFGGTISRTGIESRGAIRVCGKSATNDPECTNNWYLFAADGQTGVIARLNNDPASDINITGELSDLKQRVEFLESTRRHLRTDGEGELKKKIEELTSVVENQQAQIRKLQAQIDAINKMMQEAGHWLDASA